VLFALGAFFTALGVILLRNAYPAGARTLGLAMLAVALWVTAAAAEPLVATWTELFLVVRAFKYVGVCALPALFFIFVARYAMDTALPAWAVLVIVAVPAASLGLVLTNPLHELMWSHPPPAPGLVEVRPPWGWWFLHVHTPAQYALAITALGLLLVEVIRASTLRRAQAAILFLGGSVPLGVNVAYVLDPTFPDLQQTPLSFAFTAIVFGWGFFRFRLFQVNPLAMRAVFDAVGDAVILVDPEGRVAELNPAARAVLEARREEGGAVPTGVPLTEALEEAGMPPVALEDGARTELASEAGRCLETVIRAVRDRTGQEVRGYVLVLRDVTERRAFEQRLSESESTLREIVARAPMGILRLRPVGGGGTSLDFRCILANPGAHSLLDVEPGGLEGRTLREAGLPHTPALLALFGRVARTGGADDVVLEIEGGGGEARWYRVSASALGGDVSVTCLDITRERERQEAMAREAHQDPLTGLLNRRGLELRGNRLLERVRAEGGQAGLLFLDLDDFKTINDRFGHSRGDAILKAFAGRLRGCVRADDVVARYGGDEFVVLVRTKRADDIREAAARIVSVGERPYRFTREPVLSRPSVGLARLGADGDTLVQLVQAADADMYRAKEARRA
jgi:diguanylate cyclase (GGDEF)-like protein